YDSTKYTSNFALMNNFNPSAGVTMTVNATTSGWSASTTSAFAPGRQCALFSGTAAPLAPATVEGRITCQYTRRTVNSHAAARGCASPSTAACGFTAVRSLATRWSPV